jgi:hydroxyethylthiazole kinase-like uncharacterized protein yjeF
VSAPPPVLLTADLRALEQRVAAQPDAPPLMERAGFAAAELAREVLLGGKRRVLVLAGPGNNGGDAFVVARHLKQWWYAVDVVFTGEADRLAPDARAAYDAWRAADGKVSPDLPRAPFDAVVDGLFGVGLERELQGRYAELVAQVNALHLPVLALDLPSGLHADSGRVLGTAIRAQHTATFIALKPGLLTLDGPDHAGAVHVFDLGLDVESLARPSGHVPHAQRLAGILLPRARNSHKGTFGSVGILGGATGMHGAVLLAARAALHLGAGRTYAGLLPARGIRIDPLQPELMLREADEVVELPQLTALVVGPGLGQSPPTRALVVRALERELPLLLDADALNLIAAHDVLRDVCAARSAPTLFTPHPAEAARLLHISVGEVQAHRLAAAMQLATRFRAVIALKGAGTVIADPRGPWWINVSGNPGLASAGMGDVLSGIVGALLAQGVPARDALVAGVHLHGLAADRCLARNGGPVGMTASEVTLAAREVLNAAVYGPPPAHRG